MIGLFARHPTAANILMIAAAEVSDQQSVMRGVFLRRR